MSSNKSSVTSWAKYAMDDSNGWDTNSMRLRNQNLSKLEIRITMKMLTGY